MKESKIKEPTRMALKDTANFVNGADGVPGNDPRGWFKKDAYTELDNNLGHPNVEYTDALNKAEQAETKPKQKENKNDD